MLNPALPPPGWQPPTVADIVGPDGHNLTDTGNADRLVARHGESIRYVAAWNRWLVWDGQRYRQDPGAVLVQERAKDVPSELLTHVSTLSGRDRDRVYGWVRRSESRAALSAAVELARSIPGVYTAHDDLDADPYLLNVDNGVIDLCTGELLGHHPRRLITKLAPAQFDPAAEAPVFDKFLARLLPDADVRHFIQKAVGYSLTGDVSEQVLFLLIGDGANGKSTFLSAIERTLGGYAVQVPKDLLLTARHEPHPTSMTQLYRARFASAVETEASAQFAEAQVKQLTGGDRLTCRRMREDFWSYDPTHKLWLAANHRPVIRGRDDAIWRRIQEVPFNVTIPYAERDRHLDEKLDAERAGILNWALEGCRLWLSEGLKPPAVVMSAVRDYRQGQDWFARFCVDVGITLTSGGIMTTEAVRARYEFLVPSRRSATRRQPSSRRGAAAARRRAHPREWRDAWLEGHFVRVVIGVRKQGTAAHRVTAVTAVTVTPKLAPIRALSGTGVTGVTTGIRSNNFPANPCAPDSSCSQEDGGAPFNRSHTTGSSTPTVALVGSRRAPRGHAWEVSSE